LRFFVSVPPVLGVGVSVAPILATRVAFVLSSCWISALLDACLLA
jgi:hypothetical protein